MLVFLALALQSAGPAAQRTRPVCTPAADDKEIVVCADGTDADQYRIPEALRDERAEDGPRRVRVDLGDGVSAELYGEQGGAGGSPSQRIMTSVKFPF